MIIEVFILKYLWNCCYTWRQVSVEWCKSTAIDDVVYRMVVDLLYSSHAWLNIYIHKNVCMFVFVS